MVNSDRYLSPAIRQKKIFYEGKLNENIFHVICLFYCCLDDYDTSILTDSGYIVKEKKHQQETFLVKSKYSVIFSNAFSFCPAFSQTSFT